MTCFSGCGVENFFEIQSSMNPPRLSESQKNIKDAVEEYLKSNVMWVYPFYNGRYSTVIDADFISEQAGLKILFCKVLDNSEAENIHMLSVICDGKKCKILNDILIEEQDIDAAYIYDIDGDLQNELVLAVKNSEKFYNVLYIYKYSDEGLYEISLPEEVIEEFKNEKMEDFK